MRALVVACLVSLACKQPEARRVVPPSAAEAEAFAKDFAAQLAPCNAAEIDRRFDRDLVLARAVARRKLSDAAVAGFKHGFGGVGKVLCQQLDTQPNVAIRYLRMRTVDGVPRPVIRLVIDGAINYHELELDKRDGRVKVADLLIYMTGERLSDSLGRMLDALLDRTGENRAVFEAITRVSTHVRAREWKEAHAAFLALPAWFRETKPMRLMAVQITAEIDEASYLAAMEAFAKAFPDDPALLLLQIDRTTLRKDHAGTLRTLASLDRHLGGDPYLDVPRADALRASGNAEEALAAAKRATEAVPDLVAAWWSLLTQQSASGRFAEALQTLDVLRTRFEQEITAESLGADERFRTLVASPEFLAYAKPAP